MNNWRDPQGNDFRIQVPPSSPMKQKDWRVWFRQLSVLIAVFIFGSLSGYIVQEPRRNKLQYTVTKLEQQLSDSEKEKTAIKKRITELEEPLKLQEQQLSDSEKEKTAIKKCITELEELLKLKEQRN